MVRGNGLLRPGQWAGFSGHRITQQNRTVLSPSEHGRPLPLDSLLTLLISSPPSQERHWNNGEKAAESIRMTKDERRKRRQRGDSDNSPLPP